ncbi:hypothetical protein SteCoe_19420 [Stentor coeruleus]|uniref:PX domain-containing protein n=1 Tax=Stentor coeruleus TaxID=5963 RepID=A0A1R2BU94_9CILI|nr:hypothetical protein SteCoe_19420 [Stentor coeruleus]
MEIDIPSTSVKTIDGKKKRVFTIKFTYRDWTNTVDKKLSNFIELNQVIKLIGRSINKPAPKFPKISRVKRLFRTLTESDYDNIRLNLLKYLKEVELSSLGKKAIFFQNFCGLPVVLRNDWSLGIFLTNPPKVLMPLFSNSNLVES